MTTLIVVTQADIDLSVAMRTTEKYHGCFHCPIALALKRAYPQAQYVRVDEEEILVTETLYNGPLLLHFYPSSEAREFLHEFDQLRQVSPVVLDLNRGMP